jgi:isonocardicin synthase
MLETGDWLDRERHLRRRIDGARAMAPRPWRLIERFPESQQQYFMLRHGGRQWLGRKFAAGTATGPSLSNRIEPWHLLGDEVDIALSDHDVVFDFVLRQRDEAMTFLREAADDPSSDIVFPFPARDAAGREWVCPPDFWSRVASSPAILAQDEYHVRSVCAGTLRQWLPSDALVRDPGCSTGDFIAAMADACPALRFEGQDLSTAMIDIARSRHAGKAVTFRVADAADAEPASCDGLIVRFLNAEVVTREHAMALFDRLIPTLRPGGVAILFGHTPLLVPVRGRAAAHGLRIHRCSAPAPGDPALFQFYVLGAP